MQQKRILSDLGEFKILNEYILPLLDNKIIGDDCAFLKIPHEAKEIVVTTDAGPKPMVMKLDYSSYYAWGWYTISVNVSDLASSGCFPLCISLSIDAPGDMLIDDLKDFFQGAKDASIEFSIPISGGNIRENKIFSSHGTAIGYLKQDQNIIGRSGCKDDDVLVSIGDNGKFICNYLHAKAKGLSTLTQADYNTLVKPLTQIQQMQILSLNNLISSASDNSDGILGSIWNIKEKSNCGFLIDFDALEIPPYIINSANEFSINPLNLFLFWGDWQVIATIKQNKFDEFMEICTTNNIQCTILGKAISENELYCKHDNTLKPLNLIRNENFIKNSFNNNDLNHLDFLLKTNLFNN